MLSFDENGWLVGTLEPLPSSAAYSLLSPQASSRIDAPRWSRQATRFFDAELEVLADKRYPGGGWPRADAVDVAVSTAAIPRSRLRLITLPLERAPALKAAAVAAARARGGAGFDALVGRGQRLWQVAIELEKNRDARAPLLLAAVLASILLAPVLPPGAETIYGVKGAREQLSKMG